jgi:hypothetical protein
MTRPTPDQTDLALEQHDHRLEDFDHDTQQQDRARERADAAASCWHCGGSGVRCCTFGADLRADERRAAATLHGHRSGTVTPSPVKPPISIERRRSIA